MELSELDKEIQKLIKLINNNICEADMSKYVSYLQALSTLRLSAVQRKIGGE